MPPNANLFHTDTDIPIRNPTLITKTRAHSVNEHINISHLQIQEFDGHNSNTDNVDILAQNENPQLGMMCVHAHFGQQQQCIQQELAAQIDPQVERVGIFFIYFSLNFWLEDSLHSLG